MSHHAHGTQRSKGHASRTREMDTRSVPSTWFDELHPHLRNVAANQPSLVERIHGYLSRCGPRTIEQLTKKFGGSGSLQRCLNNNFVRVGKRWTIRGGGGE